MFFSLVVFGQQNVAAMQQDFVLVYNDSPFQVKNRIAIGMRIILLKGWKEVLSEKSCENLLELKNLIAQWREVYLQYMTSEQFYAAACRYVQLGIDSLVPSGVGFNDSLAERQNQVFEVDCNGAYKIREEITVAGIVKVIHEIEQMTPKELVSR